MSSRHAGNAGAMSNKELLETEEQVFVTMPEQVYLFLSGSIDAAWRAWQHFCVKAFEKDICEMLI